MCACIQSNELFHELSLQYASMNVLKNKQINRIKSDSVELFGLYVVFSYEFCSCKILLFVQLIALIYVDR